MTNENETESKSAANEKRGERIMWIGTAVIVLLIVGMMGANVLFRQTPTAPGEVSSQSRTTQ